MWTISADVVVVDGIVFVIVVIVFSNVLIVNFVSVDTVCC